MRILHITDFHYKDIPAAQSEQILMIDELCKSVKEKQPIDYVIFTGDLVFSGDKKGHFIDAKVAFLDRILDDLQIDNNNLFVCCGNHDVYRNQEMEAIRTHMREKITSNKDLDAFVADQK